MNSEHTWRVLDTVQAVAGSLERPMGQVALAWLLAQGAIPIVGARTPEHLAAGLDAVTFTLLVELLDQLSTASALTLSYPYDLAQQIQQMRAFAIQR